MTTFAELLCTERAAAAAMRARDGVGDGAEAEAIAVWNRAYEALQDYRPSDPAEMAAQMRRLGGEINCDPDDEAACCILRLSSMGCRGGDGMNRSALLTLALAIVFAVGVAVGAIGGMWFNIEEQPQTIEARFVVDPN